MLVGLTIFQGRGRSRESYHTPDLHPSAPALSLVLLVRIIINGGAHYASRAREYSSHPTLNPLSSLSPYSPGFGHSKFLQCSLEIWVLVG